MVRFISTLGNRTSAEASILIASDADDGRALVSPLQCAGYQVRCVPVRRLDRALGAELPDLAIVDGADAPRLCAMLKQAHGMGLPVIAVADPTDRLDAIRAGADHCATPPVPIDELLARARTLLDNAAHFRALAAKADTIRLWHDWVRYLIHDLRNPLTVATAYLSIAVADADAELAATLDPVTTSIAETAAMLQDILDTDRIKHGVLVPKRDQIDLAEIAHAAAAAITGGRAVEVRTIGDTRITADRLLMRRVFANLLVNASRHARDRPVQVVVNGSAHGVSATVMNDGPGIDDAVRPHLFEPWHPIHTERAGTGIGLAFCRLVCEAHGGRIWLDNAAPGAVTFAFGIPRDQAPMSIAEEPA